MHRSRKLVLLLLALSSTAFAQTAADTFFGNEEMARARAALKESHGAQVNSLIIGERFEYLADGDDSLFVWEGQGWIGSDINRLWVKTEGEYLTDNGSAEAFETQALYSRAVAPFWELQVGLRYDIDPDPRRSYFVFGAQGLAPYWFELDAAMFLSDEGNLSTRLEAEYDLRLTQRLILQPRIELNGAFSNDVEIGVGSGLSTAEAGLRLRYEFRREFAPYLGFSWERAFGDTRDFRRLAGESTDTESVVAGLRFWF